MRGIRFALAARTAAALLVALALTFATDREAGASPVPDRAADRILLPSAGWNGRPIQAPHRHDVVRTSAARQPLRGWSAGPVGYGTGFHRPGGSDRVREVQRRLARLGYRVGPIDGLFGRLTRASVAWFQVKHGLPVTGRATPATVRHLRARTGSPAATGPPRLRPGRARGGARTRVGGVPRARRPAHAGSRRARRPDHDVAAGHVGAHRPRRPRRRAAARAVSAAAVRHRHDDRARPARADARRAGAARPAAVRAARRRAARATTRRRPRRRTGGRP